MSYLQTTNGNERCCRSGCGDEYEKVRGRENKKDEPGQDE